MALQQTTVVDLIQVAENGTVMVRHRTDIFDDALPSNILASNYHRDSLLPGQDLAGQPANVVAICNATWTSEVIAAFKAQEEANKIVEPAIQAPSA